MRPDTGRPISFSNVESDRFGLRIFRGGEEASRLGADLPSLLWKERADVAILRVPSDMMQQVGELGQLGLPCMVADAHVTFKLDVTADLPLSEGPDDLVFTPITEAEGDVLQRLVHASFEGYSNQYSANPLLRHADWVEGYHEWASTVISPGPPDRRGWIVERNNEAVGFGAFIYDGPVVTSMLYGVLPSARGTGLYRRMFLAFARMFQAEGLSTFYNSTQLHNLASQKVWADAGSKIHGTGFTVHLNALFGRAELQHDFVCGGSLFDMARALGSSDPSQLLAATHAGMEVGDACKAYLGASPSTAPGIKALILADAQDNLVATAYLRDG